MWSEYVKKLLVKYGLGELRPELMSKEEWESEVEKRMGKGVEER